MSASTVFISGASGYIALHIIDILLSKNYTVIGTVRSTEKGESVTKNFKTKYPEGKFSYEVVKDISADGAFDDALKSHPEIKYVLHTASPFSFGLEQGIEEAYIKPAVNGTLNMLKGIKQNAAQVEKVVITSSFVSIVNMGADPKTFVHTEEVWNPITLEEAKSNEFLGYFGSKTFAERAAWDFVKDENPNFKLTTLTPPYVFGPQLFADALQNKTLNTSAEIINGLLSTTPADNGKEFIGQAALSVDVRDVALFHVLPLERDNLLGERLFLTQGKFSEQSILNIMNDKFPELRGKIATGHPENSKKIEETLPSYDITKTLKLTGVELISLQKTVEDSVRQILDYK